MAEQTLPTVTIERAPEGGFLVRLPRTTYEDHIVPELRFALAIADRVTGGDKRRVIVNVPAVNEGRAA